MNDITIIGTVENDAKLTLVKSTLKEKPICIFKMKDKGMPYQRSEPMIIEVRFMKDGAASHISQYIKKDKELLVHGYLKLDPKRNFFYISAEYIQFTGNRPEEL